MDGLRGLGRGACRVRTGAPADGGTGCQPGASRVYAESRPGADAGGVAWRWSVEPPRDAPWSPLRAGAAEKPFELNLRITGVDPADQLDVEGSAAVADLHQRVEVAARLAGKGEEIEPRGADDEIEAFVVVAEIVAAAAAGESGLFHRA